MFWVILAIIGILLAIGWAIKQSIDYRFSWAYIAVIVLGTMLVTIVAIIGIGLSNEFASTSAATEIRMCNEYQLQALNDNIGVGGRFYLGTGTFSDEPKYYAMIESDTGYKMETYKINEVILIYTQTEPRIEQYELYFTNPWVRFFCGDTSVNDYYKIYVPEGSILNTYQVDLE